MNKQKLLDMLRRLPNLTEGPEPLTDELVRDLVKRYRWPELDLRFIRKIGGMYLDSEKAFILPRQINYRMPPLPH